MRNRNQDKFFLIFSIFLGFFFISVPLGHTAISFEEKQEGTGSGGSVATSVALTNVSGHLYLAAAVWNSGSLSITGVNGMGLTWTSLKSQCGAQDKVELALYWALGNGGSNGTVTASFSGSTTNAAIAVIRYSGVNTSSPVGTAVGENASGGGGTTCTSGSSSTNAYASLTTGTTNSWAFAVVGTRMTYEAGSVSNWLGHTSRAQVDAGSGSSEATLIVADQLRASTGTYNTGVQTATASKWGAIAVEIKATPANLIQIHYRWRNNDGGESAATWATASQDAKFTGFFKSGVARLRFEVYNGGGQNSGGVTYQLQVAQESTCSSGSYNAVPTDTSGHWQIVGSAYITDGEATSNIDPGLTDEAATFVAGQLKDTGNTTGSIILNANEFTEIEFAIQATTNATDGANYCFRLYNASKSITPTKYAEATILAPTAILLSSFGATAFEEGILLEWRTGFEANNLGFNMYREEGGQLIQVNSDLIKGSGLMTGAETPTASYSYTWWDMTSSSQLSAFSDQQNGSQRSAVGGRYFAPSTQHLALSTSKYWLEDIDLNGSRKIHGPVTPVFSHMPAPKKARAMLLSQINKQRSAISGRRSAVPGRRSAVGGQNSALSTQRSAVSSQRSAVDGPRSAVLEPTSSSPVWMKAMGA